ncbi:hypothetical protein IMCC26256_111814 [Actinobacteria bacterium IMCC26256]|nr:hypothetical protein IMCC26256_111814 [Actinobacteria bacterium IMCC26256]
MSLLILLLVTTGVGALVSSVRRRSGRGLPVGRARTAIRRRADRNQPDAANTRLLAAGFASQVASPLLARAASTVRSADGKRSVLERRLRAEQHIRDDAKATVERLGANYDNLRPSAHRWMRYATYSLVLVADYACGVVISRGMDLGSLDLLAFSLTLATFQFFAGKILGIGLRRLDLSPFRPKVETVGGVAAEENAVSVGAGEAGRTWVSWALVLFGSAAAAGILAALSASRKIAEDLTYASLLARARTQDVLSAVTAARNGVPAPQPKVVQLVHTSIWLYVLMSTVALAGFCATLYWAMRSHPVAQRLELLESRQRRAERRTDRAMRPLVNRTVDAARALAVYHASIAEIGERLGNGATEEEMPAWKGVFATASQIEEDHQKCLKLLDKFDTQRQHPNPVVSITSSAEEEEA